MVYTSKKKSLFEIALLVWSNFTTKLKATMYLPFMSFDRIFFSIEHLEIFYP